MVVSEVLLGDDGVESISLVALPVLGDFVSGLSFRVRTQNRSLTFDVISRVVLAGGHELEVRIGVESPLETRNELLHVLADKEGILGRNLHAPTPPWIAIGVDVGSPEGETAFPCIVESSGFSRSYSYYHLSDHRGQFLGGSPAIPATWRIMGMSKAAPIVMGCGKDVA